MTEIKGQFNTALCFAETLEEVAAEQIKSVCDRDEFKDSKIRIMPDVHAGLGCTIGTTMTITDKVVPGMVGVDIGCGMETVKLREKEIDFEKLDKLIRHEIPFGREVRSTPHDLNCEIDLSKLHCAPYVNLGRASKSIGTLGGGNHFIEVDKNDKGDLYLVVHSGSRHLGCEVAAYYQEEGRKAFWNGARYQIDETIKKLKAEGRQSEIEATVNELKRYRKLSIPKDLTYVQGRLFEEYIHDMKLTQKFAMLNRKAMTQVILEGMGLEKCGTHGTTAALAMLNDAVKKGGVMASSHVGGLSGAFIPVSEDAGMIHAARIGALTLEKLEAMTAVCSVGLDMIAIPGDTPASTICGIIADEISIGVANTKTTAVRVIPAVGKKVGDEVVFGGLLGSAPIMPVNTYSPAKFIARGGRIPAPIHSLKN